MSPKNETAIHEPIKAMKTMTNDKPTPIRRKTDKKPIVYESPPRQIIDAEAITAAREEMGLNKKQLTQLMGTTSEIPDMETGLKKPTKSVEYGISLLLDNFRKTGKLEAVETIKRRILK